VKEDLIAIIAIGVFVASMMLSADLTDRAKAADEEPKAPHLFPLNGLEHSVAEKASTDNGVLYDESSMVMGTGDISIRGSFSAHAMDSTGWMKGTGSINFESLRSMNKRRAMVNFTQKSDLVFEGGQLRSEKSLESPLFYGGIGASVNEWFNLSHVDKSETDIIRSINRSDNTLVFDTEMAFDGIWDIKNKQGWLFNAKRSEQKYSGSFQTQKNIEFRDFGKN
jgi:hypothetical protein